MALNFPNSPTPSTGAVFTGTNNVTYVYDGTKWVGQTIVLGPTNPFDQDLNTFNNVQFNNQLLTGKLTFDNTTAVITDLRPTQNYRHSNTPTTAMTGGGSGCLIDVQYAYGDTVYSQISVNDGGTGGYAIGDQLLVTGDVLGGTSPANDLIVQVTALYPSSTVAYDVAYVSGTPPTYLDGLHVRVSGYESTFGEDGTFKTDNVVAGLVTLPNDGDAHGIKSQNGQGQIYFNTDNSLLFIITGTYQVSFNADGTVTFPGYVFPEGPGTSGQVLVAGDNPLFLEWQDQTGTGGGPVGPVYRLTSSTAVVTLNSNGILDVSHSIIDFGSTATTLGGPVPGGATDKIRLWDFQNTNPSGVNYAIGAEADHVWFSTDVVTDDGGFKFYSTSTEVFKIGGTGSLMWPTGYSITASDPQNGIAMTTDRGTILFGNHPEQCEPPTSTAHFHIMKQDPTLVDLFFGDDFNYVKLPNTGGVVVGTSGTNIIYNWQFGADGTLTAPQNFINEDGSIIPRIDAVATLGTWTNAWDQIHVNNIKTRGNLDIATGGEYSYWYSVYENVPNNSITGGGSVNYDSVGNLYTFGVVWDSNSGHYDTLALKYDPDGNLLWRKAWIDSDGQPCGTYNQTLYIDTNDVIYWTSISSNNTGSAYVGTMDVDGNISETATRLDGFINYDLVADAGTGQVYLSGINNDSRPAVVSVDPGSTATWVFALPELNGNNCAFAGIDFSSSLGVYTIGVNFTSLDYTVAIIYNLDASTGAVINAISLDVGFNIGTNNVLSIALNHGFVYAVIDDVIVKLTTDLSTVVWCQQYGTDHSVYITDINFDSDDNVYITGTREEGNEGLYAAQIDADTGNLIWGKMLRGLSGSTYSGFFGQEQRTAAVYQNQSLAITGYTEEDATQENSHAPSVITVQLPLDDNLYNGPYGNFELTNYNVGQTTGTVTATMFTTTTYVTSGLGTNTNFIPDIVLVNPDYVPVRYEIAPGINAWRFDTNGYLNIPVDGYLGWGATWPAVELVATTASQGVSLTYVDNNFDGGGYVYLENDLAGGVYAGIETYNDITNTNYEWLWNSDGTMQFPNDYLDTGDRELTIKNTLGTQVIWQNGDIQGTPNELIDSGFGTFYRGSYIANAYSNSDATGTIQTVWFFGGNPDTGGNNNVLQIGTFNNTFDYEYDPGVDIQDANGNSLIYVATTATAPGPRVEGQLWYNTQEGQLYIRHNDLWIDASPTVVPPPSTYLGGLTVEGTTISTVDGTGTVSILSGETNVWTFNNTGTITFPDGTEQTTAFTGTGNISFQNSYILEGVTNLGYDVTAIVGNNTRVSESLVSNNYAQLQWINSGTAVTVDGVDIGYAHSAYNWAYVDSTGFNIENFPNGFGSTFYRWNFTNTGTMKFPDGSEQTIAYPGPTSTSTLVNGTYTFAVSSTGSVTLNGTPFTSTLVNGTYTVALSSTGQLNLPGAANTESDHARVQSANSIDILSDLALWTFGTDGVLTLSTASVIVGQGTDPNVYIETINGPTTSIWTFGGNGSLTLPGNIAIHANVETNSGAGIGSISGAPVTIWSASTSTVSAAQIVCRSNVNYGGYMEMFTANVVKDSNGNVNVLVTGQVGSTSTGYSPSIVTAGINGSGQLYAQAYASGGNDANFLVSITEFY